MLAWRAFLPALKYCLPLRRLVRLMDARPARGERCSEREQRVVALAERVFDVGRADDSCFELSLVTYRYLAAAGADPRLVIAIRSDGDARGHAWVTVDGAPVHDSPALLEEFTSVITFEPGGPGGASGLVGDAGR
jgi:Transglutaminase-like superfamily